MPEHDRLRRLLEPEAPRLDPAAAARLDARLEAALAAGRPRRLPRWSLAAAPALLALLALLWFSPWQQEREGQDYFVLNEQEYLSVLQDYQSAGGSLDEVFVEEDEAMSFDDSNWSDEDWELFRTELESFQLSDNGGNR